jgi:5-methyltetrahydropteroyltriglutamate--homocysteine methyltransferase
LSCRWQKYLENDFKKSVTLIQKAIDALGTDRIFYSAVLLFNSFALRLDLESNEETLTLEIKQWLACQTKNRGGRCTRNLASNEINENDQAQFEDNTLAN